ncbi:unnamed protein product [Notodromas monacha]|uniref:Transmembrane protein n=1 Tax=Notodromas monacha TaxID=399045 RepID=A0A7R9BTF9_9CRUS|nr:unnamed protein product [Notodromas monacha]CAG0921444.1 unnamed protein product [Notodromas monacha]
MDVPGNNRPVWWHASGDPSLQYASYESNGTQTDDADAVEVVPVTVLPACQYMPSPPTPFRSSPSRVTSPAAVSADEEADVSTDNNNKGRKKREEKLLRAVGRTVAGTGLALIIAGMVNAALGIYGYTIPGSGKYYLGFGLLSGATTCIAGCAGLRAGQKFGDKHFVRGYILLVGFSMMTTLAMLTLSYLALVRHPGYTVDALAGSVSCLGVLTAVIDTLALALCCCYCPPSSSTSNIRSASSSSKRVFKDHFCWLPIAKQRLANSISAVAVKIDNVTSTLPSFPRS